MVVCDYGSFIELNGRRNHSSSGQTRVEFTFMILDLRHPCSSTPDGEFIENVRWWVRVNSFLAKCLNTMKRLVIEQTDLPQNRFLYQCHASCAELTKCNDEILAMKVAFVYHPAIFFLSGVR